MPCRSLCRFCHPFKLPWSLGPQSLMSSEVGWSWHFFTNFKDYRFSSASVECPKGIGYLQAMAEAGGPRQPWHDWHCKIEGPAAYDILTNFEQRWRKATLWHDDELIQIERISWILGPKPGSPAEGDPKVFVTKEDETDTWHVQVWIMSKAGVHLIHKVDMPNLVT